MFCSSCGGELADNTTFCGQCGTKVGATGLVSKADDTDKLMIILSHLGGVFFGFIPSLIVYIMRKDTPSVTLDNAREALNWQITVILASIVCFILSFILIGLLLFWVLLLTNLVLCIIATAKSSPTQVYRYPFSVRLLKP